MLERLTVGGLGIIQDVAVEFRPGFTVLTGETGAGKSLLVESLELLTGARASADLVRAGDDRLRVEGWFRRPPGTDFETLLADIGVEGGEELVIRREVTAAGRSRCWVNDVAVTAGTLQRLTPDLISIHGQHEQFGLADASVQRRLVDQFGNLSSEVGTVADAWRVWSDAAADLQQLETARQQRRDRLDAISFQIGEIDGVNPEPGEDERLRNLRSRLRHAARLAELSSELRSTLGDDELSVVSVLARNERVVAEMTECGLEVGDASAQLAEARIIVEEVLREVTERSGEVIDDPRDLDEVESRLHRLEQLMLKYGGSTESVLEHRESLVRERATLDDIEDRLEEARARTAAALEAYDLAATKLQGRRVRAAAALVEAVEAVLEKLEMAGTRLEFRWAAVDDPSSSLQRQGKGVAFDTEGVEQTQLMLAANAGEELRPMARIASGGELSRLHLALRSALRRQGSEEGLTLLFDEVDTGLGGRAASALAGLLADLAGRDQILVVTHLAQVAGTADSQLEVSKVVHEGRTLTEVRNLEGEPRVQEIARMLAGGRLTESALAHARELLAPSGGT